MRVFITRSGDFEEVFVIPGREEAFRTGLIEGLHRRDDLAKRHLFLFNSHAIEGVGPLGHMRVNPFDILLDALAVHQNLADGLMELL